MIECAHAHAKARIHWQKTTDQFWWSTLRSISCHDFLFFLSNLHALKINDDRYLLDDFLHKKKLLSLYRAIAFATSSLLELFFFWSEKKWLDGKIFVFNWFFLRWKIPSKSHFYGDVIVSYERLMFTGFSTFMQINQIAPFIWNYRQIHL